MKADEVQARQQPDGTWTVYLRHVPVLTGLPREETKLRAQESPEDVVQGTRFEWQWRNRAVARERITGGLMKADDDD